MREPPADLFILLYLLTSIKSGGSQTPLKKLIASLFDLFAALVRKIFLLERVSRKIEDLIGLVTVVVNVLLGAFKAGLARALKPTAEHKCTIFRQWSEEGIALIRTTFELIA